MRKLIAMLAACAGAMGLHAAATSGTGFEGLLAEGVTATNYVDTFTTVAGELIPGMTPGEYWDVSGATLDEDGLVVKDYAAAGETPYNSDNRSPYFSTSANSNYLAIATSGGTTVTRYAKDDKSDVEIDGSYYFDSLVQFTAFETNKPVAEVLGSGGKLAIWLRSDLDNSTLEPTNTSLIVSAGHLSGTLSGGGIKATQKNYECTVTGVDLTNGWHRVTVRAFQSIYDDGTVPGFAIAIDKKPVNLVNDGETYADTGIDGGLLKSNLGKYRDLSIGNDQLIPSAVVDTEDSGLVPTISSVSFAGVGAVDDLSFADDSDVFQDSGVFTIRPGDGVTSVTYEVGGVSKSDLTVPYSDSAKPTVVITGVNVDSGYVPGQWTVTTNTGDIIVGTTTIANDTYTPQADLQQITINAVAAGATVVSADGTPVSTSFATVKDAFDAISAGAAGLGTGPFTVTLSENATEGVTLGEEEGTPLNVSVVLDLAGHEIAAAADDDAAIYLCSGNLTIIDSVGGGVVTGEAMEDDETPAIESTALMTYENAGELIISNGTFIGVVTAGDADPFKIFGGKFDIASNEEEFDGLNDAVVEALGDTYELAVDGDYYVVQEIIVWTVTYRDPEDGEYEQTESVTNNNHATGPATAPTAPEGYEFDNWYTNIVGDVTNFVNLAEMPITADVTLYAGWKEAGGGLDPASGKTEVEVTAESAAAAETTAKAEITVPAGSGADPIDYADYFKYGVESIGVNTYEVSITGIVETIEASVAESAVQRLTDGEATDIEIPAGLYFRITPSTVLPISGTPTNGLSTGSVIIDKPGTDKGFYKVELNATPLN